MKKSIYLIMLTTSLVAAGNVFAEEEKEKSPWTSSVELGVVRATGNTETQTVIGKADTIYEIEKWRHTGHIAAFGQQSDNAEGDSETSAERYAVSAKTDYKFTELDYVFGLVKWDKDRFSGFEYEATVAAGYGRKVIKKDTMELDLEIGPGETVRKVDGDGKDYEAILRLAGNYWWDITDNSKFTQKLSTEIGEDVTTNQSITGISANIVDSLALKFTYRIDNKSKVPAGNKKTDTVAGVSLIYNF